MPSNRADFLLIRLRDHADQMGNVRMDLDPPTLRLLDLVAELDDHLSAGGTPPEAWREGPDDDPYGSDCSECGMHVDRCPYNGEHAR